MYRLSGPLPTALTPVSLLVSAWLQSSVIGRPCVTESTVAGLTVVRVRLTILLEWRIQTRLVKPWVVVVWKIWDFGLLEGLKFGLILVVCRRLLEVLVVACVLPAVLLSFTKEAVDVQSLSALWRSRMMIMRMSECSCVVLVKIVGS